MSGEEKVLKSCQSLEKFLSGFEIYNIRKKLSWVSYILLGAVLFFALINNVKPEQLDVKMLSISNQTIHSPINIEDKITTDKKKREAAQKSR